MTVEVQSGETASDIGRRPWRRPDVVASVDGVHRRREGRADEAAKIQVGFYELKKQM